MSSHKISNPDNKL